MSEKYFFNIDDPTHGIRRELAKGTEIKIFPGENVMLSVVDVKPDTAGELHSHPQEQWGLLLQGSGIRTQNGKKYHVSSGVFWQTPGGMEHGFKAGSKGAKIMDKFRPPRDEYRMTGTGFHNGSVER